MKYLVSLLSVLMIGIMGCSKSPDDPTLSDIAEKVSDSPKEMLLRLDSVDIVSLNESDKYFYALLRIKAQDKAYVKHTTDSVILKVIDYYSKHPGGGHYPEALYYGGRVYRDLGDGPTALRYFQDALDALPEGTEDELRCRILSQTGSLLNSMRLYSEASKYIKKVVELQSHGADSINQMRDLQLLGAIYMHDNKNELADSFFRKARDIGRGISHNDTSIQNMYLAGIKLYQGDKAAALNMIRSVIKHFPEEREDIVKAYATQIYLEAGIYDSVYLLASSLIKSSNNDYRKIGYGTILSPELRRFSSLDSLLSYSLSYRKVLDEFLCKHNAQQILIQSSVYNYQNHDRDRQKAEKVRNTYMFVAGLSMVLVLILVVVVLYFRNKSMRTILHYHEALDNIALLRDSLIYERENKKSGNRRNYEKFVKKEKISVEETLFKEINIKMDARDRLRNELLILQKEGATEKEVPEAIKKSSAYQTLQNYIEENRSVPDNNNLWEELEKIVLDVSPNFKSRLYLLAGEKLKRDAYHLALLIKCGATPTELSILTGRTKGAISSRRGYLCAGIFGEKLGATVMDDIIKLL